MCIKHLFLLRFRLNGWIKAHAHTHSRDYSQAVNAFRQLDERSPIRGNHSLLASLGETYYYSGDSKMALITLQRVNFVQKLLLCC